MQKNTTNPPANVIDSSPGAPAVIKRPLPEQRPPPCGKAEIEQKKQTTKEAQEKNRENRSKFIEDQSNFTDLTALKPGHQAIQAPMAHAKRAEINQAIADAKEKTRIENIEREIKQGGVADGSKRAGKRTHHELAAEKKLVKAQREAATKKFKTERRKARAEKDKSITEYLSETSTSQPELDQ